ncbi:membrane protein [Sphingomonas sp. DBB INV C78]|uniref:HPP family protein n=1 Tax=Sphingomonas sp. DBB INV C78 TaxID=3349434 RepID=UPI0036D335C6
MPFTRLFAPLSPVGRLGWLRACLGALCGIILTGLVCRLWLGNDSALPILIAPMGASAVLLFAVPASPLAQPWSIIGGNTISALAGIGAAMLVRDPIYAAGLAVALAIGAMSLARCLHPPGGAVALTAVIGGPAIHAAGFSFALVPVALNTALLLALGWLFNNATRHSYPHRAQKVSRNTHGTADPPPQERVGYTAADIDTVLARYDELLDVSRDDLDALFRQVEAQAHRRLHGEIRCERIMSRDVIRATPEEGVGQARDRLLTRSIGAMPVVEGEGVVVGLVGHAELLAGAGRTVGEVMATNPCLVSPDTPIDELLPALSGGLFHEAIVVDGEGRLAGMITQTDLLAALWRGHVAERVAGVAPQA